MSSDSEFDSIEFDEFTQNGIYKCEKCSMHVPYSLLEEHLRKRHKTAKNRNDPDDIDCGMENAAEPLAMTADDTIFRSRSVEPRCIDMDFDTTDVESAVGQTQNPRKTAAGSAAANSMQKATTTAHGGRSAERGGDRDRFQQKRFERLRLARETSVRKQSIDANPSKAAPSTSAAATAAQMRRKIPTASELFSFGRSQSEVRTHKANGISSGGNDGIAGGERGQTKKFGVRRRSMSVQRTQIVPENFVNCKFCSNLMHKDYVDDHIRRKHHGGPVIPNRTRNGMVNGRKSMIVKAGSSSSGSASDISASDDNNSNGQLNRKTNDGNVKASNVHAKKNSETKTANKHDGFRRCELCNAYMHIDFMIGHLIRKHYAEYIDSSGICFLKHSDDELNNLIQKGRLFCKNGAFYVKNG